jgi:hypothetical protein
MGLAKYVRHAPLDCLPILFSEITRKKLSKKMAADSTYYSAVQGSFKGQRLLVEMSMIK